MAALYQLAWEDTFGGTALDRAKWNVRIGNWSISEDGTPLAPGWGNNEQQYYRDDAQNSLGMTDLRSVRFVRPLRFNLVKGFPILPPKSIHVGFSLFATEK